MPYVEFSAYEPDAKIVEHLVEKDIGAKEFFECQSRVTYIPNLERATGRETIYRTLAAAAVPPPHIIATTIELQNIDAEGKPLRNRNSTHSLLLLWDGITIYLYDPNGAYDAKDHSWIYKIYSGTGDVAVHFPLTTESAAATVKAVAAKAARSVIQKAKIELPTTPGIQVTNPTQDNSPYIGYGGYCMFYNWIAINYINQQLHQAVATGDDLKAAMKAAYNQLCNPSPYVPFPPAATSFDSDERARANTLEYYTAEVVKKIPWSAATRAAAAAAAAATATATAMDTTTGGGAKRRRKRRSKRRSLRRRKRRRRRPKKRKRKKFTRKRKKIRQKKPKKKRRTYKIL